MTNFSQRNTRVYIHSFNKTYSFMRLTNIYCFPLCTRSCVSPGDPVVRKIVCVCKEISVSATSPYSLPHTHTPCKDLSNSISKDGHLALAVWQNDRVCGKGQGISKSTIPHLLSVNPKSWEPQIPHQLCIAISHPTLRNSFQHCEPESALRTLFLKAFSSSQGMREFEISNNGQSYYITKGLFYQMTQVRKLSFTQS